MDSPSRQESANAAARSAPTQSITAPPPPSSFHGSRYLKVLGRIDEESSFRASLSNINSQDSSPRSTNSFEDSEGPDWLTSLSPERSITFIDTKKEGLHLGLSDIHTRDTDDIHSNQNDSLMIPVTNVEDRNMDSTAVLEEIREGRSSPVPVKSKSQLLHNPEENEKNVYPQLPKSKQEHKEQEQQQQQHQKFRKEDEQNIRLENESLRKQCKELEHVILQMKTEGNILQMRTVMKLKNYEEEIERATERKKRLQSQCHELEDRIYSLRTETQTLQENIFAAEEKLRQKKR